MTPSADLTGAPPPGNRTHAPRRKSTPKSSAHGGNTPRQLPQSLEAEKGLLCSVLLSPREVLNDCVEHQIEESAFYFPAHGVLYRVLLDMWSANTPIDLITLNGRLEALNLLESVGGPGTAAELLGYVPTAANAPHYLDIVREKALLRSVITVCTDFTTRCYEEQSDVPQLIDDVEQQVFAIGEKRLRKTARMMREEVYAAIANIERMYEQRGRISGLETGFTLFDKMTDGLHGGEMIIIAARPAMGKTALAMNIVEHVALHAKEPKPVGVFSLEMSTQQLVQRMLFSHARVKREDIIKGIMAQANHAKINNAAAVLSDSAIFIDDTPGLSIMDLRSRARRLRERQRVELIVIDYLQLCRSPSKRGQENRQIEIAEISSGIKALAKELDIPIIVLAQLNRQPEQRGGGKPRISDLRESGSIEQDADVVTLLVRPEVYEEDVDAKAELKGKAELYVAKQRNGPTGTIPLTFINEYTRFENTSSQHPPEED